MADHYSLEQVSSVAAVHPFYNPDTNYLPTQAEVARIRRQSETTDQGIVVRWSSWPLLHKDGLRVFDLVNWSLLAMCLTVHQLQDHRASLCRRKP